MNILRCEFIAGIDMKLWILEKLGEWLNIIVKIGVFNKDSR